MRKAVITGMSHHFISTIVSTGSPKTQLVIVAYIPGLFVKSPL